MLESPKAMMIYGTEVDFETPTNTNIALEEILIHTSNINRYCGAIDVKLIKHLRIVGYFVEEITRRMISDQDLEWCQLQRAYAHTHDFTEAYLGDVVTALKKLPMFEPYRKLEHEFDVHIHNELGIPIRNRNDSLIKKADHMALAHEMWYHQHPAWKGVFESKNIESDRYASIIIGDIMREPISNSKQIIRESIKVAREMDQEKIWQTSPKLREISF